MFRGLSGDWVDDCRNVEWLKFLIIWVSGVCLGVCIGLGSRGGKDKHERR